MTDTFVTETSRKQASRKRVRASLLTVICAAMCRSSSALLVTQPNPRPQTRPQSYTTVSAVSARRGGSREHTWFGGGSDVSLHSNYNNYNHPDPQTTRLSHEEQRELLLKAVDLRRIKQLKSEMALQNKNKALTTLQISRAAGYGDELHELEDAMEEGERARESLITTNMGLVHFCVREILQKRKLLAVTKDDLLQEGVIGLARAVDRWNPAIGGKFSTYAVYWIRAAVLRCLAERDDPGMRVPEHVTAALHKLRRAAAGLNLELDDDAWREAKQAKALAERAGLSDRQMEEAMKVRKRRLGGVLSFESWMQQGRDLANDLVASPAEEWSKSSDVDFGKLKQALSQYLRPKEIEALSLRYGLNEASTNTKRNYLAEAEAELFGESNGDSAKIPMASGGKWGEAMSFVEVGRHMKVSAEYGRRLCHAALDKLRRAAEDGSLEPAFLF